MSSGSSKTTPPVVFIALGSNLGDSREILQRAMECLQSLSDEPIVRSSLWETTPIDCPPGSPPFLNAVVSLTPRPQETPETLLATLQQWERDFGRRPKQVLNEPRPLDLDLIRFGEEVRSSPQLTLPHPRAGQRRFVLEPLAEIAPDSVLPGQLKSVAGLLAELPPETGCVKRSDSAHSTVNQFSPRAGTVTGSSME